MTAPAETSRFGKNLISQFILGAILGGLTATMHPPLSLAFGALCALLNWSVTIGIIYALFRLGGTRVDFLETYYQHFPVGLGKLAASPHPAFADGVQLSAGTSQAVGDRSAEADRAIVWEKLLSADYIRYAGLILIISAVFAFLFRIEWSLPYKIIGSFVAAAVSLIFAEISERSGKKILAGSCYLVGFAFAQFGATLLFKYFYMFGNGQQGFGFRAAGFWLGVKAVLTAAGVFGLFRYRAVFVPVVFFLIAYLAPVSMLQVVPKVDLLPALIFVVFMTVLAQVYAVLHSRYGIALLNVFIANLYALSYLEPVTERWQSLYNSTKLGENIAQSVSNNTHLLYAACAIFVLHVIAGAIHAARKFSTSFGKLSGRSSGRAVQPSVENFELILNHVLGLTVITSIQANIPAIDGYFGLTLLIAAGLSFAAFLVLRSKEIDNIHTEIMLNLALAVSIVGMFINTRGTWTAIVFLLFSCVLIYISFVLGTLRTRAYAFAALTVSMIKLYFECSELFDSIPGTAMVLGVGIILMVLSFKLDDIKTLITTSDSDPPR